jgi:hypothetical protein
MLVVETIAHIRRACFVQKKAIQEICQELKVSRKTVRRVGSLTAASLGQRQTHAEVRDKTNWKMFEAERPSLVPYAKPLDGFCSTPVSPSKTCLVHARRMSRPLLRAPSEVAGATGGIGVSGQLPPLDVLAARAMRR